MKRKKTGIMKIRINEIENKDIAKFIISNVFIAKFLIFKNETFFERVFETFNI